jgi:hypothetical protein
MKTCATNLLATDTSSRTQEATLAVSSKTLVAMLILIITATIDSTQETTPILTGMMPRLMHIGNASGTPNTITGKTKPTVKHTTSPGQGTVNSATCISWTTRAKIIIDA